MDMDVVRHFQSVDPLMAQLAVRYPDVELDISGDLFTHLAVSVISQQLSEKAGDAIWKRFTALFPGNRVTPERVKGRSVVSLRSAGMSKAKVVYVQNIADAFLQGVLVDTELKELPDTEVVSRLVNVRGVGQWTAEMFLIFALGRKDVFSFGDAGLSRAMQQVYGKRRKLSLRQKQRITAVWSPYRSYACLLLWKSLS